MSKHKKVTKEEAFQKAAKLCSSKEKCRSEIERKLREWQMQEGELSDIIDKLESENYIDEQRFADAFVSDKFKLNKWGKIKIHFALKERNIADHIILKAISNINPKDYQNTIENELISKKKQLKGLDIYQLKSKLIRFGQSKGFENDIVFTTVSELIKSRNV